MDFYTIAYWVAGILIAGAVCKTIVPKSFWERLEVVIVNWQTKAITQNYNIEPTKKKKKYRKFIFIIICLAIGILLSIFTTWWIGTSVFLGLYLVLGVILIRFGVIE